jgi:hypothetical protein
MPGASEQTRRVKIVNANWVPGIAGRQEQFEIMIITEDDQRHVVPASAASATAVVAQARAGTVMAWDPEGGGTLIAANIVGQMPWTKQELHLTSVRLRLARGEPPPAQRVPDLLRRLRGR